MLADFVRENKDELIERVELHAAADEGPGLATGRHRRVAALVEELIETLQSGRAPTPPAETGRDAALRCHERFLIEEETVSKVVKQSVAVPPCEMVIVSEWANSWERRRLDAHARRLSDLLDDVRDQTTIVAPDGRIEYLNRRAASYLHELSGVPLDQLIGKTGTELGLPEEIDFSRHPETIQAFARQRASMEEPRLGHWFRTRYRAISSESGELEAIAFVKSDIEARKLAELRLEILSRLSALVGSVDYEDVSDALASIPIPEFADWCTVNLIEDGRIVHTSVSQCDSGKAALREAVMRAAPSWNENPFWRQLKLTSGFQLLTDVSDALLSKLTIDAEQHTFMKQVGVQSLLVQPVVSRGQIVAILNLVYTTESGRRYGRGDPELAAELALHAAHIIENARLLRDLRSTEARFHVSLAGSKTAVFEQDASLRYLWYYSPKLSGSDFLGLRDDEIFSADDAAILTALKRRALESDGTTSEEVEVTFLGERRSYALSIEAMRDHAGKPIGIIGSAMDITDEKRKQRQLTEVLGFRDRILAVLGHDLRNPLNAVKMAASILLRQDPTDAAREKVEVVTRAADRMTEMIETLLDVARVRRRGGLPITRAQTDVGVLATEVASELAAAYPDRALQVDLTGEHVGRWDPARVRQAISNLVANGLEHGDPSRPVRLSVERSGEAVIVKVTNERQPIPAELRPVLFEAFSRGTTTGHGLGLGLFIVKQIAIAHGGRIDVESSAETGTVFTLVLPRAA